VFSHVSIISWEYQGVSRIWVSRFRGVSRIWVSRSIKEYSMNLPMKNLEWVTEDGSTVEMQYCGPGYYCFSKSSSSKFEYLAWLIPYQIDLEDETVRYWSSIQYGGTIEWIEVGYQTLEYM